jgi:hypothetical protein
MQFYNFLERKKKQSTIIILLVLAALLVAVYTHDGFYPRRFTRVLLDFTQSSFLIQITSKTNLSRISNISNLTNLNNSFANVFNFNSIKKIKSAHHKTTDNHHLAMSNQKSTININSVKRVKSMKNVTILTDLHPINKVFSNYPQYSLQTQNFSGRNKNSAFTRDLSGTLPFIGAACCVLMCDHVYDFFVQRINPAKMKNGDLVYVKTDLISDFFSSVYPNIRTKFILFTHNSDYATSVTHRPFLDDAKLLAWFGENPGFVHPKHFAMPIGLENPGIAPRKLDFARSVNFKQLKPWSDRTYLLYVIFEPSTNRNAREFLIERFKKMKNSETTGEKVLVQERRVDYLEYMSLIGDSKFVLCPRGNGLDTYRFYEAVLMGAIPVVENSTLWPVFVEAEAVVVSSLSEVQSVHWLIWLKVDESEAAWARRRRVIMWSTWEAKINAQRMGLNEKASSRSRIINTAFRWS